MGGPATAALLWTPTCVIADGAGGAFVSDTSNHALRRLWANGTVVAWAGIPGTASWTGDNGLALAATLKSPAGLSLDSLGLLVADAGNAVVRRILPSGIIITAAGTGTAGAAGNGGAATSAQLSNPTGVGSDGAGNFYIVSASWRRWECRVRREFTLFRLQGDTSNNMIRFVWRPTFSQTMSPSQLPSPASPTATSTTSPVPLSCALYSGSGAVMDPCCRGLASLYPFGVATGDALQSKAANGHFSKNWASSTFKFFNTSELASH